MTTRTWTASVPTDWKLRISRAADPEEPARPGVWAAEDEPALIEACLNGDRTAFDPIVERYRRPVYQVCFRFAGNHADASDLAQETFIRAFKGLRGYRGQAALGTWLYRIAINVCLNRAAIRTPRPEALVRDHADHSSERPDQSLLREERARQVRAAITRLPRKQRATLILRAYHDLRHEEIAQILGSSVGAVKANFFHALANLRKLLR